MTEKESNTVNWDKCKKQKYWQWLQWKVKFHIWSICTFSYVVQLFLNSSCTKNFLSKWQMLYRKFNSQYDSLETFVKFYAWPNLSWMSHFIMLMLKSRSKFNTLINIMNIHEIIEQKPAAKDHLKPDLFQHEKCQNTELFLVRIFPYLFQMGNSNISNFSHRTNLMKVCFPWLLFNIVC